MDERPLFDDLESRPVGRVPRLAPDDPIPIEHDGQLPLMNQAERDVAFNVKGVHHCRLFDVADDADRAAYSEVLGAIAFGSSLLYQRAPLADPAGGRLKIWLEWYVLTRTLSPAFQNEFMRRLHDAQ